jgi:DNA-binding response OmpR family regulator
MTTPTTGVVLIVAARDASDDGAIHAHLSEAGLRVRVAADLESAIRHVDDSSSDVLVVGSGEDTTAAEKVASLRAARFEGAILVASRNADPSHVAAVLDRGADDYVRLPCNATELVARVRALARRGGASPVLEREIGGLVLDLRRGVIRTGDAEVALTRREADLLEYLTRHAGQPVSRAELATQIWHTATPSNGGTNIVDVYISYLRRKLGALGRQSIIRSVRGVGYELRIDGYELRAAD